MDVTDLPGKMMSLQLKKKAMSYNCYMPFLEHGDLSVPTDDIFSLDDGVLFAVEIIDRLKKSLRTQIAWINPARTSAHRPKGVGPALGTDEICTQTKQLIETGLGNILRSDRTTSTLQAAGRTYI